MPKLSLLYNPSYGRLFFLAELLLEAGDDNDFSIDLDRAESNVLFNWVPPSTVPAYNRMRERTYGAHLVYLEHDVHLISEFLWVEHDDTVTQHVYRSYGVFGELGYYFGDWLPLVRYERIAFVGLKYLLGEHIALKVAGNVNWYESHTTAYQASGHGSDPHFEQRVPLFPRSDPHLGQSDPLFPRSDPHLGQSDPLFPRSDPPTPRSDPVFPRSKPAAPASGRAAASSGRFVRRRDAL